MMNESESLEGPITQPAPVARIFWVISSLTGIAASIVAAVNYSNPDLLAAILVPMAILTYQWKTWPRRDSWSCTTDGLENETTGEKVLFSSIQGVTLAGHCQDPAKVKRRGWLAVYHPGGVEWFPRGVRPDVQALYRGILQRVSLPESGPANQKLEDFYQKQVSLFGKDRVWAFNPRPHIWHLKPGTSLFLLWIALVLIGIVLLVLSGRTPQGMALGALGVYLLIICLFGLLITAARHLSPAKNLGVKNHQHAGLVLGPLGIGLVQDHAVGQLKWEEIKSFKLGRVFTTAGGTRVYPPRALYLNVQGAEIAIADIYDYPLPNILHLVRMYWKKPGTDKT